jgi:hypothetical protein
MCSSLSTRPWILLVSPIELWPRIVTRCAVPVDTEALLVAELEKDRTPRDLNAPTARDAS